MARPPAYHLNMYRGAIHHFYSRDEFRGCSRRDPPYLEGLNFGTRLMEARAPRRVLLALIATYLTT